MAQPELLYYFTHTKYALEGVKNRRLKVAELDKANDPYELLPFRWEEGLSGELFINRAFCKTVESWGIIEGNGLA